MTLSNLIPQPIFLVGSERSGTTLLRLMLDHHPDIAFNLESDYLVTKIAPDGTFPDLLAYRKWLASDRVFKHSRFTVDQNLGYADLMNNFLTQKLRRDNKRIVGVTIHYAFSRIKFIWPQARYIYLYRDGRDVASSIVNMGWAGNSYVAADQWLRAEVEWLDLRKKLAAEQWIEVQYEKLISQPVGELRRICTFLGVEFSDKMFDYTKHSTYAMPDERLNYQWKRKMGVQELRLLESKIGIRLLANGYELSGHPAMTVSPIHNIYLNLQSQFYKFLWRAKQYGLVLTLGYAIAKRFGIRELKALFQTRIDRIIDGNLK